MAEEEKKGTVEEKTTEEVKEKPKKVKKVSQEEYDKLMGQFEKAMNTAAHHQNLSKYYQSEYDKVLKYRSQYLMENLLPVIDSFELAFKFEAPTKEALNYRMGFEYIYRMLIKSLEDEGLAVITPKVGDLFNGDIEQIVDVIETEDEKLDNHIAEVLLNGYKLKDRLLRPGNVKIYKLKTTKEVVKEEDNEKLN